MLLETLIGLPEYPLDLSESPFGLSETPSVLPEPMTSQLKSKEARQEVWKASLGV